VARAAEHVGTLGGLSLLGLLVESCIRRYARAALGAEVFARLDAYRWQKYPPNELGYGFWRDVLTGARPIGYPPLWPPPGWAPALTVAEFYERFPYQWDDGAPHPGAVNPLGI
jgi:hypothetical protein